VAKVVALTYKGLEIIVDRLRGLGSEPKYAHWGEGGDIPAAATDIDLVEPRAEARVAGVSSKQTTAVTGDTYQVVATLTAEDTPAEITEFGLFDSASGGRLFLRATFDPINVSVGDSVQFTVIVVGQEG